MHNHKNQTPEQGNTQMAFAMTAFLCSVQHGEKKRCFCSLLMLRNRASFSGCGVQFPCLCSFRVYKPPKSMGKRLLLRNNLSTKKSVSTKTAFQARDTAALHFQLPMLDLPALDYPTLEKPT